MKGTSYTLVIGGLFSSLFLLAFSFVRAAETASVSATVTVQNISVAVSDGTVVYGTLGQNATRSTDVGDLNDTQVASNDGNITEDFNIRGTNSGDWTLRSTAGTDEYVHEFCTSSCTSPPTNYAVLSSVSYQTLASSVAVSATSSFDLFINTPNPSTVFTQQSVNVTVQAVES